VNSLETKEKQNKIEKVILIALKTDCTGCSTCSDFKADNLTHAIARLNGVTKVKVDEITGKTIIEYDTQKSFSLKSLNVLKNSATK
jgi:hypothetical protein